MPSGSNLYFNHPNWSLTSMGALVDIPLRSVRELDLTSNQLKDVGSSTVRFEHMVDLRLKDNLLSSIELHYLPRLRSLDLSFNRLQASSPPIGLPFHPFPTAPLLPPLLLPPASFPALPLARGSKRF